jgi:hypothetical protein
MKDKREVELTNGPTLMRSHKMYIGLQVRLLQQKSMRICKKKNRYYKKKFS